MTAQILRPRHWSYPSEPEDQSRAPRAIRRAEPHWYVLVAIGFSWLGWACFAYLAGIGAAHLLGWV